MRVGFIGLGRMGSNMVANLLSKHEVVAYDRSPARVRKMERIGAKGAYTLESLAGSLPGRKIIWIMVTAGKPVDEVLSGVLPYLRKGDVVVDGGNSYYADSMDRCRRLARKGVSFLDCGVSGGMSGARHGACMMAGGDARAFRHAEPVFRDMCVSGGYGLVGPSGAGHFAKMVHNGIEYGMMAAIAEGMEAIGKQKRFGFDLKSVIRIYSHGSIISGRLMDELLLASKEPRFPDGIVGKVPHGETEDEMGKLSRMSRMPVLEQAIRMRKRSRKKPSLGGKMVAAMRNRFGGHKMAEK